MTGPTPADPVVLAWLDEEVGEVYTDLTPEGRELRDAAQVVIDRDPIAALGELLPTMRTLDDAYAALSWIDAPELWAPRP